MGLQRRPEYKRRSRPLTLEKLDGRELMAADFLYVGDGHSNNILKFDAESGAFVGELLSDNAAAVRGPRGLIVRNEQLVFVNQNVDTEFNGEIRAVELNTSSTLASPVPSTNPQAPFAPRGLVQQGNVLYVADAEGPQPRVAKYDATTGVYLGQLIPHGFLDTFQPRGLAFGPDGGLYVTAFNETTFDTSDPAGYIFRFDVTANDYIVIASNNGDGRVQAGEVSGLHNPEGIVFGPDGRIYVISEHPNAGSVILVMNSTTGQVVDSHRLEGDSRHEIVTAQALVFGPQGKLFVPVTIESSFMQRHVGAVWKFDPVTEKFDSTFVPYDYDFPILVEPWYLIFGKSDSATLSYSVSRPQPQPPVISNLESGPIVLSPGERQLVSKSIQIAAQDTSVLSGAEIRVVANYAPLFDRLIFRNRGAIVGSWNPQSGILRLSGLDTVANYQAALRTVLLSTSSPHAGSRRLELTVTDGTQVSTAESRQANIQLRNNLCGTDYVSSAQRPKREPSRYLPVIKAMIYTVLPKI